MPVHRHFDGILRDAPHPLGSPTFYHAPAKISNKPAKLQKFVHNCKKKTGCVKASGLCRIVRALFQKLRDQLKHQLLLFRCRGAFGVAPAAFVLLA